MKQPYLPAKCLVNMLKTLEKYNVTDSRNLLIFALECCWV